LRSCGHDRVPITALDLGAMDTDARFAWGANMAIRRAALQRVGPFDTALQHGGDEQEWQERLQRAGGAPARYVARAAVEHRRAGRDAAGEGWERASGRRLFLARAARREPARRRILALGVERAEHARLAARARRELLHSRHEVELHTAAAQGRGKFENLNRLLA